MKKAVKFAAVLTVMFASVSQAHTTVFGTTNAGTPGSVNFWMGTYHSGLRNEGSLTINGSTTAFNNAVVTANGVLPDPNLVFGDNLFWASGFGMEATPTEVGVYNSTTPVDRTSLISWQSVLVTGLTAGGTYSYTISGMNTVHYADWNSGSANWTGTLFVPGTSVAVSEPAMLPLLALSVLGLVLGRRKRNSLRTKTA